MLSSMRKTCVLRIDMFVKKQGVFNSLFKKSIPFSYFKTSSLNKNEKVFNSFLFCL